VWVAEDPDTPVDSIVVQPTPLGRGIFAGDERLFTVVPADAAAEEVTIDTLAAIVAMRVREALEAYRHDRTPSALAWATGETLLALLAFALFAFSLARLGRALERLIAHHAAMVGHEVEKRLLALLRLDTILTYARSGTRMVRWVVTLVGAYVCINYILLQFPWTRGFADVDFGLFVDPLTSVVQGIIGYLPNLIFLVIIVMIARFVMRAMKVFSEAVATRRLTIGSFEPEWAMPTYQIARIGVIAFAMVMAYPYIPGSGSAALQGMTIFLGVILSLGSSSIIANVIAGYSMNYRCTFRIGDVVRIGEIVGEVTESRLLVTCLRTPKNEVVTVPNSMILASEVINYSEMARGPGLLVGTRVGIGYETPWRQVEAMLLLAAERTPGVLPHPRPFIIECGLGDSAVNYELNVATDLGMPLPRLQAELQRNVLDVFNEFGVVIMTPANVADPADAKRVRREDWYAAPARAPEEPAPKLPG